MIVTSPVTKLVVMRLVVIEVAGCWYVKMGVAVVTGSGGSGAGGGGIAAIAANMLIMARTMLTSQTYTTAIQNHGHNHHIAVDSPGLVAQSERSDAQTLDSSSSSDRLATCQSICERQSLPDSTPEDASMLMPRLPERQDGRHACSEFDKSRTSWLGIQALISVLWPWTCRALCNE